MPGVTVGERILVHLSGFLRHVDAYEVPPDMTQDGIGSALGLSRAHVALELKRLKGKRLVEETRAHVNGNGARRKVYRAIDERRYAVYTPEGERVPLVRASVREIRVAYLRCPSCGKESRVALDT